MTPDQAIQVLRDALHWCLMYGRFEVAEDNPLHGKKLDKAREALTSTAEVSGWQTMESAPRDGTYILLHDKNLTDRDHHTVMGKWPVGWAGWEKWDNDDYYPTHWMPLPPAPEKGG